MNRLIGFFIKQGLFADIITIALIILGVVSMLSIRREVFPNVTFDVITVTTIFPGASPEEAEKLLTNPIEQAMKEVDGIKKLSSVSAENLSYVVAQLDPDTTTADKGKVDIQDVLDRTKADLPTDAEDPVVISMESKFSPIIEVSVAGDIPEIELREVARQLEEVVESVPDVAKVVYTGMRDLEIRVEADPAMLMRYQLSLDDLVNALRLQNVSVPGGTLTRPKNSERAHEQEVIVRTIGEYKTLEDIENTVVRANDLATPIRVRDIAKVRFDLEKASVLSRTDGKTSIALTVMKKERGDAIRMVAEVKRRVSEAQARLDSRVSVSYVNDFSYFISRRLGVLSGNLMIGLALVLIILSLILPFRVAILVSLGIPFSFMGAMIWFHSNDYSLNLISMIGLIIVSGMLVDDAVLITDNAVRMMEEGMDPETAAYEGTVQIWPAVTASILTTTVAFVPMLFMSGIFGKFIQQIPIGVITALIVSLLQGFFILPYHIRRWIRVQKKNGIQQREPVQSRNFLARIGQNTADFWDYKLVPAYVAYLEKALKRRYLVGGLVFVLFVGSLGFAANFMKFVLFPPDGIEIFHVNMRAPIGIPIEQTAELVRPVEKAVLELPKVELENVSTKIGLSQNDPNDPNSKRGSEYAQVTIYLTPETARERTAQEIIDELRAKVGTPPGIEEISFDRVRSGPPVGSPVSVGLRGKTYEEILPAVQTLKEVIAKIPGTADIRDSYIEGKRELLVKVDGSEAAAAGLSVATVGTTVRTAYEGIVATSIRRIDEEVDIRVSWPKSAQMDDAEIGKLQIPNRQGQLVLLSSVASLKESASIAAYEHEGNERQVRVTADLDTEKTSPTEAARIISSQIPEMKKKHPTIGYFFGGEDEDTKESMASLGRAFLVAFTGIFLILIMLFKTLLQPVLVLLTIPLGIIAVIWTFFLHGRPLSFLGMLGIIALSGVIVNNAIVFIDFVNQNRTAGMDRWKSILDAARARVRPIFLTTVTTVAGLLPTAYGIGGLDPFVVPIALSLGWGLMAGSVLTIFAFPVALALLDDFTLFMDRLFKREPSLKSNP